MSSRSVKALAAAILIAGATLAAYWYWSPLLVIRQMRAAAEAGDADTFNAHVDYPMLRESLTEQIADKFRVNMGRPGEGGEGVAASGSILGMALVGPLVDRLVSPRVVMRAMQQGFLGPGAPGSGGALPQRPMAGADEAAAPDSRPHQRRWTYERIDLNQLVAKSFNPGNDLEKPEDRLALVFQRYGFADWKLTDISIPALNK